MYFIFGLIYILSVIWMRYLYRLCSSRHYDIWMDSACRVEILWFVPVINTLSAILLLAFIKGNIKSKKNKILCKSKWLNTDL